MGTKENRQGGRTALPACVWSRDRYCRKPTVVGAAPPHVPPLVLWRWLASARIVVLSQVLSAVWTSEMIPATDWPALHALSSAATACEKSLTSAAQRLFPDDPLRAPSNVRPLSWEAQLPHPGPVGIVHTWVTKVVGV